MATESQPLVVGDVWADNDPRNKGVLVEIKDVDDTHVTLFRPSTGRTSRVKRERMRPIATGYVFVESPGLPDKEAVEKAGLIGSDMLGQPVDDVDLDLSTPNVMESPDVDADHIDLALGMTVEESHKDGDVTVVTKAKVHSAGYSAHTHDDRGIVEKIASARTALEKADLEREDALAKGHKDLGPFPLEKINRRSHFWFAGRFYRWITGKRGGNKAARETDTKTLRRLHEKGIR